jgi:predicted RNA binding protein YcfA (HicA-like mRNA interferase family)
MGERIRRMTARDVERLLKDYGFELISQKGSHRKWRHPGAGLQVIVPDHRGRTRCPWARCVRSSRARRFPIQNGKINPAPAGQAVA